MPIFACFFYSSLCDILIFFFQFFLLPIIAHYCPLWLKKHFLLQLANNIAYYCVLYNTIFTLLYSGIFYILNFYYCPLLPTLAKKALLPSPGFPGIGKPGLGNIANPGHSSTTFGTGPVFFYKLRYIVSFRLVEMTISTNLKLTIYRNLYENTGPVLVITSTRMVCLWFCWLGFLSNLGLNVINGFAWNFYFGDDFLFI